MSHNTLPFDHFVSCTGDGASTQTKFNQLVEREAGKERGALIENKCSMHLGVNLRCAQVRAMKGTVLKDGSDDGVYGHDIDISESINSEIENEENCESEFEARKRSEKRLSSMPNGHIGKEKEAKEISKLKKSDDNIIDDVACQISVQRDGESCHGNVNEGTEENYDSEFEVNEKNEERFDGHTSEIEEDIRDMDPDVVHNKCVQYETDVDRFVHEICKLFGHLGTPEYGQGAAFRIFLAKECDGDDQDYYQCTKNVYLKQQIGSRYYVTSCNAAHIFFLRKAMLAFLNEQKMLKKLNLLELTCLKKLNDPVLLTMVRLEGLMFDHIYADLMMLVKSKDLKKSAFDMNIHYQELLSFLNLLATNPTCLLKQ